MKKRVDLLFFFLKAKDKEPGVLHIRLFFHH